MNKNVYDRTKLLIGSSNLDIIKSLKIAVLGAGGVGSYVIESLARLGVLNITIIDKDIVDITNINRQLIATEKTVGMSKVDVCKSRINEINSDIAVINIKANISDENIADLLEKNYDYIVDCVDDVSAKLAIIKHCNSRNIRLISSMGMGNKLNPLEIKVTDINKTIMCPLAKKIRKELKSLNIKKLKVIYSEEKPYKKYNDSTTLGSLPYVPSVAGLIITSEIVKDVCRFDKV